MTPPGHQLPPAASSYERRRRHRIPWFIDPSAAVGWRASRPSLTDASTNNIVKLIGEERIQLAVEKPNALPKATNLATDASDA